MEVNSKNYKACNDTDNIIIRQFINSIIFRSHISSHKMFKDFKLIEHEFLEKKM